MVPWNLKSQVASSRVIGHGRLVACVAIARLALGALILLVLLCPRAPALDPSLDLTQYSHTAWTSRDGLMGSTRSIVQTPDGYLWIGTEFGLFRFDGVRFVQWSPPPGQHLPSSNIVALLAASDGTLWIGTLEGLASWKDRRLTQYPEINGGALALLEDHEGTVWVGSSGRLCSIRGEKSECQDINGNSGTGLYYLYGNRGAAVYSLYEDTNQRLWTGTELGLWQFNPGPPKRYTPQQVSTQQGVVQGDRAAGLVFISGEDYVVRQLSEDKIEKYAVPGVRGPFKASHLLRDRNAALWIGTYDQGLLRVYQGKTSRFALGEGLSGNLVTAFFEDREGSIWVGTTNGLDRFRAPAVVTISAHQGLRSPVWSVLPARDVSVWIGSFDGLQRWNKGQLTIYLSGGVSQFGRPPGAVNASVREITDPGLPDNYIGSLYEDQRGRVWVTTSKGVVWFENGRFTRVSGLPVGSANAIIPDQGDGVWISYPSQGFFHVAHGEVVQTMPWPWSDKGEDPRLSAVVPDSATGGLWLGSARLGIAHFKDGQLSTWLGSKNGLGADLVWNLHVDHEGTLWAATEGGLSRVRDGRISTLTTRNGLPCNAVHWVIEDDGSSLWLSTACGLVRIDRSDLQAWALNDKHTTHPTIFDGSDGFRMHAMLTAYSPVVKKAPDGKLWFAHNDGVSVIDPKNLRPNNLPPPVHIEQITANGKTYAAVDGLRLPPRVRDLAIDYTALSLVAPEKVRFRFKLEGQDQDWREVVNGRHVQYSNLAPSNYRFRVIACNNSGVWNEHGATLDFAIAPAYYQTNWFRALCVAAFLALLWVAYQVRVRQLRRQEKKLRDVVETIPTIAWTALPDGRVDFSNHHWEEYTGVSLEKGSGSGWEAAVHPDDVKQHAEKWRASVASGEPFESEARYRRADGTYRWFLVRAVPLRDGGGKILKWYGTKTDIEDRKRAEQLQADMAHTNRVSLMGELAASLSHELKQPIAAAITNARTCVRWLKRQEPDVMEASEAADRIVEDGKRAADIIDRLRSLYKKSPPQRELVQVNEIVREMVVLLRGQANRYAVSIRPDLADALPKITADRVQLQQVLMNLMLNGIEAMKETGGVLTVKSRLEDGSRVAISVSDIGVGLPTETADQIFNTFFTTKPQGSGMGLAISRSIVESHGGRLWATANSGRGATFHFTLPTAAETENAPATAR